MNTHPRPARVAGFTLVELMITILIGTILLGIAVPSYNSQIRRSRRTEARDAVLDLATREERYYSVNNSYSSSALDLGYGTQNAAITGLSVGSNYYTVTVTASAPDPTTTPPTPAGFIVTALAVGAQAKDTQCATLSVDQSGAQTSTPTTTVVPNPCWK